LRQTRRFPRCRPGRDRPSPHCPPRSERDWQRRHCRQARARARSWGRNQDERSLTSWMSPWRKVHP